MTRLQGLQGNERERNEERMGDEQVFLSAG